MPKKSLVHIEGLLRARIATPTPDAVIVAADDFDPAAWRKDSRGWWVNEAREHNAFVNAGLEAILDRYFGIGGPPTAPTHIILSSDNTAVTAATTAFGGTISAKAFNGGTPSRAGRTVTVGADYTKADANFVIRKIGISRGAADGAAQDIIGGAGAGIYAEAFTIDLTATAAFDLRPEIDVTLSAV